MEREELEKLLEDKVMKGELQCGLYDTGLMYVRVYLAGDDMDDVCFEWFDSAQPLDGLLIANKRGKQ